MPQVSEPAFFLGHQTIPGSDSLRLVFTVDDPTRVASADLLISDATGTDVSSLSNVQISQLDDHHFQIRWDGQSNIPLNSYFRDGEAHKTFTATLVVATTDGHQHLSEPYPFEIVNPAAVNRRYRAIAELPAVRGSNLSGFADSIRTISQRIWSNVERSLKFEETAPRGQEQQFADVSWVVRANTYLHRRYSQAIAYYLDKAGEPVPDFLLPDLYSGQMVCPASGPDYQASAMWQSAIDSCGTNDHENSPIRMLPPAADSMMYHAMSVGIQSVFNSGDSIPFNTMNAGAIACFCNLGNPHLYDDVKVMTADPNIGSGNPQDWQVIEGYARDQVVTTLTLPHDISATIARAVQYVYYESTSHAALDTAKAAPDDSPAPLGVNLYVTGDGLVASLILMSYPRVAAAAIANLDNQGENQIILSATGAASAIEELPQPERPLFTLHCNEQMKDCKISPEQSGDNVFTFKTPPETKE